MVGLISSITILASPVITLEPSQTPAVSMLSFLLSAKILCLDLVILNITSISRTSLAAPLINSQLF